METTVARKFTVRGTVEGMFTPDGGTPAVTYISGLKVELWHKGPMVVTFLGEGFTAEDGGYTINFECESPNAMIVDGVINDVFIKVYYGNEVLTGNLDADSGSFD
jgi:hypothetical protein